MKYLPILGLLTAAIISLASANGVAEEQNRDRTGSPDGSSTCTACHLGGSFNPSLSITVEDSSGEVVSGYIPGEEYTMKFAVTTIPFATVFGFQATALFSDLSDAGTFHDPGTNVQLEEVNTADIPSRHVVEHSAPGFVGNFQVQWTAPFAEDTVHIYAAGVTANGNNEPEGDRATNTSLILPMILPDNLSEYPIQLLRWAESSSGFELLNAPPGHQVRIDIFTPAGRIYLAHCSPRIAKFQLAQGVYLARVQMDGMSRVFKFYNP